MISITPLAADKVKEIAQSEGLDGQGLRLRVIGGGCAGFQYDLYFEDKPTELDESFESQGVQLYIDPLSYQYLDGTEIDYVEGVHGAGFKFGKPKRIGYLRLRFFVLRLRTRPNKHSPTGPRSSGARPIVRSSGATFRCAVASDR